MIRSLETTEDFQKLLAINAFQKIIKQTTNGFTIEGLEHIDTSKNHIFVMNHRDIVLDSSLFQIALMDHGFKTTEICIGDNLMPSQFFIDIWRSNKMVTVVRGASIRETLQNSLVFSKYLRNTITNKHESVWIAQRNGRTKDGIDVTDPALIKMFAMSGTTDILTSIAELNIIPVAISYQIEPCDWMKTRELFLSKNAPYQKAPNEDFQSILTGIMQRKGKVHIAIRKPINPKLEICKKLPNHAIFKGIAKLIDNEIISGYKLFDTNYIAYDLLNRTDKYASHYAEEAKQQFVIDMNEKIAKIGLEFYPELCKIFFNIYANPVFSLNSLNRK
ncbi:MAG: 1-acyl-sn-glycerol-3-phosphate acyltransferase, partial [Bacteroidales bacterium]|jgi:1-acyl-sn-glycerol-3-phosphate acyltransferase|nr:1-acyl-sn-glycerol-3-phosphate acyltransferase [Bacteroidales bacterium]